MHSSRREEAAVVLRNLRQLVHGLRVTAHAVEHELELTGAQLFVLRELAAEPGVSVRRLSERTLTDPSSASVVVERLVQRRLVKRQRDPADRRRSVLTVTEPGLAVLERAPEPYQTRLFAALSTLPRQRLRQLNVGLSALLVATDAGGSAPLFFEEPARKRSRGGRRAKSR